MRRIGDIERTALEVREAGYCPAPTLDGAKRPAPGVQTALARGARLGPGRVKVLIKGICAAEVSPIDLEASADAA